MLSCKNILHLIMAAGLILGIHEGYLALLQTHPNDVITVYPYKVSMFPSSEQEKLKSGISIVDDSHLKSLLQDYLS